jgi:hypothetical protein
MLKSVFLMYTKHLFMKTLDTRIFFYFLFVLLVCKGADGYAQRSAVIDWESAYGGSSAEWPANIVPAHGGGYMIAGVSSSFDGIVTDNHGGFEDGWLLWIENNGFYRWARCYGGKSWDAFTCIRQLDTAYIVSGYTFSTDGDITLNHGQSDAWVLKLSKTGDIIWQKTYGGKRVDKANSIIQTNDGGYIYCGTTNSTDGDVTGTHDTLQGDIWVVKLDDTGKIEWQRCLGGSWDEIGYNIIQTKDSNYIIAGETGSKDGDVTSNKGFDDVWIIKLDRKGNILWQKTMGGSGTDYCKSIIQTSDGGYIAGATTSSADGDVAFLHGPYNEDFWVLKLDDTGKIEWQKSYGGWQNEEISTVIEASGGGYLINGKTQSADGDVRGYHKSPYGPNYGSDEWLLKIDYDGNIIWQKSMGGSDMENGTGLLQIDDSTYVTIGSTGSNDGDVTGFRGSTDYWPVQIHESAAADTAVGVPAINENSIQVYPSLTNGSVHISLPESGIAASVKLIDVNGNVIAATVTGKGTERTMTIPQGTAAGMLIVQVYTKEGIINRKIIYVP